MIRVKWIAVSFVMRQRCFPHIGMFSFIHRECVNQQQGRLRNKIHLHSIFKGCFYVLKDFEQSRKFKAIAQKRLQFYMFPTKGFCVIQTETRFCNMENGWQVRMSICIALWSFLNGFSQPKISTDNTKVKNFLHSNMFVAVVAFVLIGIVS